MTLKELEAKAAEAILRRCGIQSRAEVDRFVAASWERNNFSRWPEPLRATAALMRKGGCGRRGLPSDIVATMYRDYQRLGSLAKVARVYRRTRQAMYDIFRRARLPLNPRNSHARIFWQGRYWTPGKGGYYRETIARNPPILLHHAIWEKRTGRKIPKGWQVTFKNGDASDFTSGNLVCLPIDQVPKLHHARRYPGRFKTPEEKLDYWRKRNREYMRRRALWKKGAVYRNVSPLPIG